MNEEEWLATTDPQKMLELLRGKVSERKVRLFLYEAYRRLPSERWPESARKAVLLIERYADGLASRKELLDARSRVCDSAWRLFVGEKLGPRRSLPSQAERLNHACVAAVAQGTIPTLDGLLEHAVPAVLELAGEPSWAAGCLRDLFGTLPFHSLEIPPLWLASTVVQLAQAIYDDRAFHVLPVLADALEEAGCDDADILAHCRGPGPHVRGCFVVDLLLQKT